MASSQSDLAQVIRANNAEFEKNVRAQDAAKLVEAFYAPDAVVMPPDAPTVSGLGPIKEFWQGMFNAGVIDATLKTVRVDTSADLATEVGQYTLTMKAGDAAPVQATGKYLVALRKQPDGSWKTIADMFSSNAPAG